MEVRFLWVQQEIRSGRIPIKKIAGVDNPTDIATKHVDTATMMKCQSAAGLRRWTPRTGLMVVLTMLPLAAAVNEDETGGGWGPFMLAMSFAVYGLCQAVMRLRRFPQHRTPGTDEAYGHADGRGSAAAAATTDLERDDAGGASTPLLRV